jgi:hypothetical protein
VATLRRYSRSPIFQIELKTAFLTLKLHNDEINNGTSRESTFNFLLMSLNRNIPQYFRMFSLISGIIRLDLHGLLDHLVGVFEAALLAQTEREIVIGAIVFGIDFDGLLVRAFGSLELS